MDAEVRERSRQIDAIRRLQTIPGVGPITATTIYAWVGDVSRFPNAKALAAYARLVPEVRQSGNAGHLGSITKMGAKALRSTLVQATHVLIGQCRTAEAVALHAADPDHADFRISRGESVHAMRTPTLTAIMEGKISALFAGRSSAPVYGHYVNPMPPRRGMPPERPAERATRGALARSRRSRACRPHDGSRLSDPSAWPRRLSRS